MTNNIIDHYSFYDEDSRLKNQHSLERIRTQDIILRNMNNTSQKMLDIGGGTGVAI